MKTINFLLVALVSLAVVACSGGSSSTTATPTSAVQLVLTGTVATGLPISNATLIFKDKTGKSATTTSDANGQYNITAAGLTAPCLVKITTTASAPNYPTGTVFYSVTADSAAASSVVNVTPLTDLVVRSWYKSQPAPVTADVAFADPVTNPPPEPGVVTVIENVVRQMTGNVLASKSVDPMKLNLITTPFVANATATSGVNAALSVMQVNAASGSVSAPVVAGTLNATISVTNGTITTTTQVGAASSVAVTTVPTNTQGTMITGIQAAVDAFAAVVNAKGTQLADTDILPLLDANAMMGGLNRTQTAIGFASMSRAQLAGDTISMKVLSLDSVSTGIAQATMLYTRTTNGAAGADRRTLMFAKQANGQWLWAGDMRIAQMWVDAQTDTSYQPASAVPAVTTGLAVDVQVLQPASGGPTLTAAAVPTINGTSLISTNLIANGTSITSDVPAPGAAPVNLTYNKFSAQNTLSNMAVAAGNTYTITIPVSTGAVSYPFTIGAVTNEAISITGLTAGLANAQLGTPLTVNWTLPSTFTVLGVQLDGSSQNGATNCYPVGSPPLLPATATSSTITLPATCGASAATGAAVTVSIWGANGELTHASFVF